MAQLELDELFYNALMADAELVAEYPFAGDGDIARYIDSNNKPFGEF